MGFGTTVSIYISRHQYDNIHQVECAIDECNKLIELIKTELKMYISSTPQQVLPKNSEYEPIEYLRQTSHQLFDDLEMAYRDLIALEYLHTHFENSQHS